MCGLPFFRILSTETAILVDRVGVFCLLSTKTAILVDRGMEDLVYLSLLLLRHDPQPLLLPPLQPAPPLLPLYPLQPLHPEQPPTQFFCFIPLRILWIRAIAARTTIVYAMISCMVSIIVIRTICRCYILQMKLSRLWCSCRQMRRVPISSFLLQ